MSQLSHHGLRSFIDFLDRIPIDCRSDYEIINRLFQEQPSHLVRLFISDLRKRYSQQHGHFPNLFLVDATIQPDPGFKECYGPHLHTYWLKYWILKYIALRTVVTFNKLADLFVNRGGFSDSLFRLALGSLAAVNESACLCVEHDHSTVRIAATPRGRFLVLSPSAKVAEFCLSFDYLQLVIDDPQLSLPKPWFDLVHVNADLGYVLRSSPKYGDGSWKYLQQKMPAALRFLRILKASHNCEAKAHQEIVADLISDISIAPDFDRVSAYLLNTFEHLLRGLPHEEFASKLRNLWKEMDADPKFDDFFAEYARTGCEVVAP